MCCANLYVVSAWMAVTMLDCPRKHAWPLTSDVASVFRFGWVIKCSSTTRACWPQGYRYQKDGSSTSAHPAASRCVTPLNAYHQLDVMLAFPSSWRSDICSQDSRLETDWQHQLSRAHELHLAGRYQATMGFWDCADQIEKWAGKGYSDVVWYLVSDSQSLRCLSSPVACLALTPTWSPSFRS